jgi:outer membrane protein OmpA-like peptidoglycan-associated protein/Tol biopolymer transport system component
MHMKKSIVLIILLATIGIAKAQQSVFTGTQNKKADKLFGQALQLFTAIDYTKSLATLNKAIQEDPKFVDAWMLSADIYEQTDNEKKAIETYQHIVAISPLFQIPYYKYARLALSFGEYDTAHRYIEKYIELKGNQIPKEKVSYVKQTCDFAIQAIRQPVPFDPINIDAVNTSDNEYFPGTSADDQLLIFTRLVYGRQEDFFTSSKLPDGTWGKPQNMGAPINTDANEGTISLSPDGQYVFFTGCNRQDGLGSCDIYFSQLDGNTWKTPRSIGSPINSRAWESQPSLSFDGKTLYFTSNRPGGFGGMDIWMSQYSKGRWSVPQNLGPEINSTGDEQCPYIAKDDQTLYFNSDTHVGMGGVDLFVSRRDKDGRWQKPENLGYPINTQADEICLVIGADGKTSYYVSKREGGKGGLDLYQFELYEQARPQKTGYIKGIVYDGITKEKLQAKIELIELNGAKTNVEAYSNKLTGAFLICLQGNRNYALNVNKEGYLFYSENIALQNQSATDPLIIEVPLYPIQAGRKVVLKNIFFDVDLYALKPESKVELDKLATLLKNNPLLSIEVSGHTDNTGNKQKNIILSNNRAIAVKEYLITQGIEQKRLLAKGYGDTQPIADNKTEAGRTSNRRTEFKILSK